jgi:hypothetical protein
MLRKVGTSISFHSKLGLESLGSQVIAGVSNSVYVELCSYSLKKFASLNVREVIGA